MNDVSHYQASYYQRPIVENWYSEYDLPRPDELAAICYAFGVPFTNPATEWAQRYPGQVVSIGCGAGRLEAELERLGCDVIGVDPSPGAKELYRGSTLVDRYEGGGDTIVFCESLEHLPVEEIDRIFALIPDHARVIVVNWLGWDTIVGNHSWDHITTVDADLFDRLSDGWNVRVRNGSHLVLDGRR